MRIERAPTFRLGILLPALLLAGAGCRSRATVAEAGAALVRIVSGPDAPRPDELRTWVYDDQGTLWNGARLPESGALPPTRGPDLGTVLIQPGSVNGALRVDVRGFGAGVAQSEGVVTIAVDGREKATFEVDLAAGSLADADGDGVPDAIDDCPGAPDPAQRGCPSPGGDASLDVSGDGVDGTGGAPAGGSGGSSGSAGTTGSGGADMTATGGRPGTAGDTGHGGAGMATDGGAGGMGGDTDGAAGATADGGAGGAPTCAFDGGCARPLGAACAGDGQCESGTCADGVCCKSSCVGPCRSCNQPSTSGTCTGYTAGTDPEIECTGGATCNGVGACGPPPAGNKTNGQACLAARECASGFCADGACCDNACDKACESCRTGKCTAVTKAADIPECSGTMSCNARGACVNN